MLMQASIEQCHLIESRAMPGIRFQPKGELIPIHLVALLADQPANSFVRDTLRCHLPVSERRSPAHRPFSIIRRHHSLFTSVLQMTTQVTHRHGHVLFDRAAADPELGRHFAVAESFKLVQPQDALRTWGQVGDCRGKTTDFLIGDESGFGIGPIVRSFFPGRDRAVLRLGPVRLALRAPAGFAHSIQGEIIRHAE